MKLCFDSIDEVKDFVKQLKGTRGGKGEKDDEAPATSQQAPAPLQPPAGGSTTGFPGPGTAGFAPPGQGAGPATGFPAPGAAPALSPEAQFVANKINPRLTELVNSGHNVDQMLNWFRVECSKIDPAAASASMDQIKAAFLPKMQMPMLEHIAGLIGVPK